MLKSKLYLLAVILGMLALVVGACAKPAPAPAPAPTPAPTLATTPTSKPAPAPAPGLTPSPKPAPAPVPVPTMYGTVEVRATDAPPTGVSKIMVYTKNIQVHKAGSSEDTWTSVISEEKSFNLMDIIGAEVFLGSANVTSGNYTQIRMDVTRVLVTLDGKEIQAKLPGEKLKVVRPWEVRENQKTVLTLDFEADKFVVITGKNEAQVKPVLKLEVTQGDRPLKTAAKATPIENIVWILESYGEPGKLQSALPDAEVTVRFNSTTGKVEGSAGVNRYFAGYEVNKDKLTLKKPIGQTMMAGPEPLMKQETRFLSTLQVAESYKIEGGKLQILCGKDILVFRQK